jgi:probable F420-dependent oxidoreductase
LKLAVEFPSVIYREGPDAVARLGRALEEIGFDEIDVFDHVVMGHPVPGRPESRYRATMPLLEALTTLGFLAAATRRIGLGTEVLVLPQRPPVLVAKQVATLDTLSGGRMRLGVGVGWQQSEYEALGETFGDRGRRMDDAIVLLRKCWRDDPIEHGGDRYPVVSMAMEPKPPRKDGLPIWVGGHSPAALRRAGRLGDGWMAVGYDDLFEQGAAKIAEVRRHAEEAGRDPSRLGFQAQISRPPREGHPDDRTFYADADRVVGAAARLRDLGFGWGALNLTGMFLAGARSVPALIDSAAGLHARLRRELGRS